MKDKFTEEDKKKVIEFLNTIAKHARYEVNTEELINIFKLLSFMQQVVVPKLEANILEVRRVVEQAPVVEEKKETPKKAK